MEKKLSDAAMEGSVEKLNDLIRQDPLVLERALVSCVSETPLHVASMLGHLDMVVALLSHNPEFASELDSSGSTPLHLAAARGHVAIVKELMRVADSAAACLVKNGDGRTALHVAAVKGRVEVLAELVQGRSESSLTDRGESAMHLCAGYNRLEGLKVLVEAVGKDNSEVLNLKDGNGNTVLHIAVAKKQFEMIKYLVSSTGVNVNALNANSSTALDILLQSPRDLRDMEIEDCLQGVGAQRTKDIRSIEHDWGTKKQQPQMARRVTSVMSSNGERTTMTRRMTSSAVSSGGGGGDSQTSRRLGSTLSSVESESSKPGVNQKPHDWLGRKRSSLMVVASLLATTAFSAAITPPEGVWQDDYKVDENGNPVDNPHTVGTSIMAYSNGGQEYGLFMIFNTVAFLASLSIILLLVSGLPLKKRRWMWIQMVIMWIAITTQVSTYFLSFRQMSPKNLQYTLRKVTEISVLTWLTLMVVVFFGNVIRLNLWVLRKYGYLPPKEERPLATIDEELEEV